MKNVLDDLSEQFSGRVWGANGPLVVTRAMTGLCGGQVWVGQDVIMQCEDVTVFRQGTNNMIVAMLVLTNFPFFVFICLFEKTKYERLSRKVCSSIKQKFCLFNLISEALLSY